MKLFKQITCAVLTLCLCAGLLLIPSAPVSAATGPSAPKAVDVSYYKNYPMVNDSAISVQLGYKRKKHQKYQNIEQKPESQSNKTFTFQLQ